MGLQKTELLVKFVYEVTKILNTIWLAIQDSRFLKKTLWPHFMNGVQLNQG